MLAFNLLPLFSIIQPLVSGLLDCRYSAKKYRGYTGKDVLIPKIHNRRSFSQAENT